MSNELLPCPFCGGDAVRMDFLDNPPFKDMPGTRYFGCRKCCVVSFTNMTEQQAIEAWNTRAGRTCKAVFNGTHRGYEPRMYCSDCGTELVGKFCYECGAKVVE